MLVANKAVLTKRMEMLVKGVRHFLQQRGARNSSNTYHNGHSNWINKD
jgi:hypothetical protein